MVLVLVLVQTGPSLNWSKADTGSSRTGKTYICMCISYLTGYTYIFINIDTIQNCLSSCWTLFRLVGTVFKHFLDWLEQCLNTFQTGGNVWHLFKVFEHFNIFVPDYLHCVYQILLIASFPTVPLSSKSAEWLQSYSCFCVCSNSLSLFGNCLNTCSKCSNISIYLRRIVRFVGFKFSLTPAFQRCLCRPNQWTGCWVIHVFRLYSTVDL